MPVVLTRISTYQERNGIHELRPVEIPILSGIILSIIREKPFITYSCCDIAQTLHPEISGLYRSVVIHIICDQDNF